MGEKSPAKMEILNQLCQKLNTHKHRYKTSPIGGCPSSSVPHLCSPPHPHPPLAGVKVGLAAQCPSPVPKPRALPHSQHAHPAPVALCQPPMPSDPLPDSPTAGPMSPVPPPDPKAPGHPRPQHPLSLPGAAPFRTPRALAPGSPALQAGPQTVRVPGPIVRAQLAHGCSPPQTATALVTPATPATSASLTRHGAPQYVTTPRPAPSPSRVEGGAGRGRVSHVAARAARRHRRGGGGYVCVCVRVFDICDVFYN